MDANSLHIDACYSIYMSIEYMAIDIHGILIYVTRALRNYYLRRSLPAGVARLPRSGFLALAVVGEVGVLLDQGDPVIRELLPVVGHLEHEGALVVGLHAPR